MKTPSINALHKLGRIILALVAIVAVVVLIVFAMAFDQVDELAKVENLIMAALAPAGIYSLVKGTGR